MKTTILISRNVILGAVIMATILPAAALTPSFTEDFESGLGLWTGRAGGSHNGIIVSDPLASGHNGVLTFTSVNGGGDLFASSPIALAGNVAVSFDYLGVPSLAGTPGDLGGFFGIVYSLTAVTEGVDQFWYAGTRDSYPGLAVALIDDGAWHHYTFQLNASAMPPFHLVMEDYLGSGGIAGDAFFDNVSVEVVPEPSVLATLAVTMLSTLIGFRRRE